MSMAFLQTGISPRPRPCPVQMLHGQLCRLARTPTSDINGEPEETIQDTLADGAVPQG